MITHLSPGLNKQLGLPVRQPRLFDLCLKFPLSTGILFHRYVDAVLDDHSLGILGGCTGSIPCGAFTGKSVKSDLGHGFLQGSADLGSIHIRIYIGQLSCHLDNVEAVIGICRELVRGLTEFFLILADEACGCIGFRCRHERGQEKNTFSQETMIKLQSQTTKRDQAYDMISNVLKSFSTVMTATVNNV